ncbi:MAG: sucrase ferredoxin [Acidimicrobiales bacterium]
MNDLRCSAQSEQLGDSPLGTAGHDDHYLLVELPLPWPKSIEDHPLLTGLVADETTFSTRLLAVLSDQPSSTAPDGSPVHRVISYRSGDGSTFSHFQRREAFIRRDDLVAVIGDIVSGDLSDLEPVDDGVTDVLICTHGSRDRCCGTDGARLFLDLIGRDLPDVRAWRTSHTGGHRFAPIALTFPDGYTWGRLAGEQLVGLLEQSLDPSDLLDVNRGCMGFADPAAQVADAVALAEFGWDWSSSEREAQVSSGHGGREFTVEIGGELGQLDVTVRRGDPIPVPACGEPIEMAKKTTSPLFVIEVERGE